MKGSGRMLMKKKLLASFCALLLVPTMAVASTNMVSISELYKKAAEMGRWRRTYETPTGTLEVDIPILKMKIIATGDEETFSVPKVITWEDVQ